MSDQPTKLTPEQEIALRAIVQMMLCDDKFEADMARGIHVKAIHCVWCNHSMTSMEEVRAHDAECPKHPLMERIAQLEAERDALAAALELTVAAMKRGVDVGCVEDLDACDDGGEFWHAALRQGVAALGRSGEANRG